VAALLAYATKVDDDGLEAAARGVGKLPEVVEFLTNRRKSLTEVIAIIG